MEPEPILIPAIDSLLEVFETCVLLWLGLALALAAAPVDWLLLLLFRDYRGDLAPIALPLRWVDRRYHGSCAISSRTGANHGDSA